MSRASLPFVLLAFWSAILLTSCEDATNVGGDLIGAQGGQPDVADIPLTDFRAADLVRPEGLEAYPRALAGRVVDPLLGTFAVQGYADFTPVTSADFRAGTVEEVELRLIPSYVYGDTTLEITVAVRDVLVEWSSEGLPTDTSFSVGEVIQEFSFLPTDSLIIVPLPAAWVAEHDDALRSANVGDEFHGFRFDSVSGNAVVGFGPVGTVLAAFTEADSTFSPIGRTYPHVDRETAAALPPDRVLMQAGAGPAVALSVMDQIDALPKASVNRVTITVEADTSLLSQDLPQHFVRPQLRTLHLHGVTDDGVSVWLARTSISDGRFVFETPALREAIQNRLTDEESYAYFQVQLPNPSTLTQGGAALYYFSSLNPVVFYDEGAASRGPVATIVYTPLD